MIKTIYTIILCSAFSNVFGQVSTKDTLQNNVRVIGEVNVISKKNYVNLTANAPTQIVDKQTIDLLGINSVAEVTKHLAGSTVRDYGGIGGMKTVSVRSFGAHHTAISYDGITISNTQAGQIDISRFTTNNVQNITLTLGEGQSIMQTARHYASIGVLYIDTKTNVGFTNNREVIANVKTGSFGLFNSYVNYIKQVGNNVSIGVEYDFLRADGAYPFTIENGLYPIKDKRNNSQITSHQAEFNASLKLKNNGKIWVKSRYYNSKRGLPGAVIFYNNVSNEILCDEDFFTQASYSQRFSDKFMMQAHLKYTHSYNLYTDIDARYKDGINREANRQDEYYISTTFAYKPFEHIWFAFAQDFTRNTLTTNAANRVNPKRNTYLTALTAKAYYNRIKASATMLVTYASEKVIRGYAPEDREKISPSLSLSWQVIRNHDLYLRFLVKNIYRMPTFNDMYYIRHGSNNSLKPENATEYNLGITWRYAKNGFEFVVTADAYYNAVKDKIVAYPSTYVWHMVNFGKVRIIGADVTTSISKDFSSKYGFAFTSSYTYQKVNEFSFGDKSWSDAQLPYTPKYSGSGNVIVKTPFVNVGYSIIYCGDRYSMNDNKPEYKIKAYAEQSITFSRNFSIKTTTLALSATMHNLTNVNYEIIKYYPMPGRNFTLSATYTF